MTDTDWKPVNPCDSRYCEHYKKFGPCSVKDCDAWVGYRREIEGQKRLLRYIRENPAQFSSSDLSCHNAMEMFKRLEANNVSA